MIMTRKFRAVAFAAVFIFASISSGCGKKTELSAADQQKLAALNDARKNGILTQAEYDAKVKDLNAAASASAAAGKQSSAASAADAQKLQALETACKSGVLSPEECAAKRAALTGAAPVPDATQQALITAPADAPAAALNAASGSAPMPDNSGGAQAGNAGNSSSAAPMTANSGTTYNDPQGAFSITVPQGWTATPQGDNGAGGVQISQGANWAMIAPFANVKQPSDVIINLERQFQRQYKNFTIGQHGPSKFNGHLDMAYAMYSGVNQKGVSVSMVILGIAAPQGRFFAVLSSVPQPDTQGANQAFSSIVQSLHFTGE